MESMMSLGQLCAQTLSAHQSILGTLAMVLSLMMAFVGMPLQIYDNYRKKQCGMNIFLLLVIVAMLCMRVLYTISKQAWYLLPSDICTILIVGVLIYQWILYRIPHSTKDLEKVWWWNLDRNGIPIPLESLQPRELRDLPMEDGSPYTPRFLIGHHLHHQNERIVGIHAKGTLPQVRAMLALCLLYEDPIIQQLSKKHHLDIDLQEALRLL